MKKRAAKRRFSWPKAQVCWSKLLIFLLQFTFWAVFIISNINFFAKSSCEHSIRLTRGWIHFNPKPNSKTDLLLIHNQVYMRCHAVRISLFGFSASLRFFTSTSCESVLALTESPSAKPIGWLRVNEGCSSFLSIDDMFQLGMSCQSSVFCLLVSPLVLECLKPFVRSLASLRGVAFLVPVHCEYGREVWMS